MSKLTDRIKRAMSCEYWKIGYRKLREGKSLLQDEVIEGFTILPGHRFVTQADPFVYKHQGKNYLFYEKQNLTDMKGTLWCFDLDDPGRKPVKVLEESCHLSYPQVFRYGKYTYMVPESKHTEEIRVYRCERFPDQWELENTLLNIPAVDTTILRTEDKGCLAFTYVDGRLQVYRCELDPGHFAPRKIELIYQGEESATVRPAGNLLYEDGKLLRPAQDCSEYYGQGLIFYEVPDPSSGNFEEREYKRFTPSQMSLIGCNPIGIHTYNRNEEYEVIDILHKEVGIAVLFKKLMWKLSQKEDV